MSHLFKVDFHINMFTPSLLSFFTTHRHIHTHKHMAVSIHWSNRLVNPVTMVNYTAFMPVDCLGLSPDNTSTQHGSPQLFTEPCLTSPALTWTLAHRPTQRNTSGRAQVLQLSYSWTFCLSFICRFSGLVNICKGMV